ncbi:hypothetical protein PENTCL1PPCAC_8153, partial [Pristionchus entomophagus]
SLQMKPLLLLILCLSCCHSFNILVYIPKFAISHINFMGKLADTLVDAGHNVTALISEMDSSLTDGTKKAHIVRIPPAEGANHMNTHFMTQEATDMFEIHFDSYVGAVENAYHNSISFCIQCRKLLTTAGLVERLKNENYDALITESFENCGVGLSHLIKPRALIPVSSTFLFDPSAFGIHYSLITEHSFMMDGRFHSTLSSRLTTIYHWFLFRAFYNTQNIPLQNVFDELYPGTPSFSTILSDAAVVFSNTEPLVDFPRPSIAKIVPIGGINVPTPKPLDDYWNTILSLRPHSVLISFGSIAKSVLMKPARKAALLKAFSSFPNSTFIWKYEDKSDDFARIVASKVPNVILTEWMPQTDILADPRLSLFVSHGGMASTLEIAHLGVPSLLIPIFGDQIHNAGALAHIGIAKVFSKFDMIDSEKIIEAIGEMIKDERHKKNGERIRDQLAARPSSPIERLVKNVEFAARFGPSKSLRPLNLDLSTIQFLGIDLLLIIIASIFLILFSFIAVYKFARCILSVVKIRKVQKID